MRIGAIGLVTLVLAGCQQLGAEKIVMPSGVQAYQEVAGSVTLKPMTHHKTQLEKGVKTLFANDDASVHVVHILGDEQLHIHKDHDLIASVVKGIGEIELEGEVHKVVPGDYVIIPRGVEHIGRSLGEEPLELFLVSTPKFDKSDVHFIE